MGITASSIRLLAKALLEKEINSTHTALVYSVLGVQGTYEEVEKILRSENYQLVEQSDTEIVLDSVTQFGNTIHVATLFKMLGYGRADTLDLFPDEHPDLIVDLNRSLPQHLWNQYDLVFDAGTAEHCFNVKEVLGNAARALRVGGRVMHILPMSGFAGHGFYQFSPDLFAAFYGANGFGEIEIKIDLRIGLKSWYFDFAPEKPLPGDFWGIPAQVFFAARKMREVDEIVMPNQSVFELPLDHPLRAAKEITPLTLLAKRFLPDVLKKYLLRKQFFMSTKLYPLW